MKALAVISASSTREEISSLGRFFDVLPLPADPRLPSPTAHHPDMLFSAVGDSLIFPEHYYREHTAEVEYIASYSGLELILSEESLGCRYPHDVLYNNTALYKKKKLICSLAHTSKAVIDSAALQGFEIISVKQGYSGCSCIAAGDFLLTSDSGIHKKAVECGIDSVYADKSGILLPGYDCGFIGGAGGYFDGVLYFFGSIDSIPSADVIRRFAHVRGLSIVSLTDTQLTDRGGIRFFARA